MADNDVNNTQIVTETQDANKDQVVTDPGENAGAANQQGEENAQNQDKTVPYDRFKEVNDQKKEAEEGRLFAERQLELIQANMQGQQQVQQPSQAAQTTLDQAMLNCGVTADDMFGEAQVRVFNEKSRLDGLNAQAMQSVNANMQFVNSHPDFTQVVGSVNLATGQLMSVTPEVTALLQKQPSLASASFQEGYNAVLQQRRLKELEGKDIANQEHLNRQGVDTASLPLGGSAAGGGGAGDPGKQKMISREEVLAIEAKLASGEI